MERREEWIAATRNKYPLDAALFGTMGAVSAKLCADVSRDFIGKQFEFMDTSKYEEIRDVARMNQVYWRETLFRVYWAAALNLLRHQRWQAGCIRAFKAPASLLSFAASLRGLLEASLDVTYSLRPVPYTLADNQMMVESALAGSLQQFFVIEELENRLIHFVYGRKVARADKIAIPTTHVALEPKDYRNAADLPEGDRESFSELYDELCGLCHPTAFSLAFLWNEKRRGDATTVHITADEDERKIRNLCQKHEKAIEFAMSLSVTGSALCLKTLNWFSLPEVGCPSIERWNFDDIPAWRKAQERLSTRLIH
ncbi:MAG TPA: hypothetical protein VHF01_08980 [Candidatus Acidoferrum sp.]|nr:hypothetical protein [Candidatus Acidoferrum sp.]